MIKNKLVRVFGVTAIASLLALSLSGCGSSSSSSGDSSSDSASSEEANADDAHAGDEAYAASDGKFETDTEPEITFDDFGYGTITGSLKNISGEEQSYAQIEFNLYDADGAQIGSTLANINNLEEDGVWKYEAMTLEDGVDSFKIAEITTF